MSQLADFPDSAWATSRRSSGLVFFAAAVDHLHCHLGLPPETLPRRETVLQEHLARQLP